MLWDTGLTDTIATMPNGLAPADPKATHWYRPRTLAEQLEQLVQLDVTGDVDDGHRDSLVKA